MVILIKQLFNFILYFFIWLLAGTLVITLINYFDIINGKVVSILKFLLPLLVVLIYSYKLGKVSDKKGYLSGLKFGGIIVVIFMLFVIILDKLTFKNLFYYLILLLTSIMGSTIGINMKKKNT